MKSESFTSTRLAVELITFPRQILFGAFSRGLKRIFLCLSHQTHLLKEHLANLKLIYITFWFDGKFYSRTCSGVDILSGVHTNGCQPLHLLSRTINEGIDWIQDALAESHDTSGLYPEMVNKVNDWVRIPFGWTIERRRRANDWAIMEGNVLLGSQRG